MFLHDHADAIGHFLREAKVSRQRVFLNIHLLQAPTRERWYWDCFMDYVDVCLVEKDVVLFEMSACVSLMQEARAKWEE